MLCESINGKCRIILFLTFLSSVALCENQSKSDITNTQLVFPHKMAVNIVAKPSCSMEEKILQKVSSYCAEVTGVETAFADNLNKLPANVPAIIICNKNIPWPFKDKIKFEKSESYQLKSGILDSHNIVAVIGSDVEGLKRGVQRLIMLSQQKPNTLVIPKLNIKASPWIKKREWALAPWEPTRVRGVFRNNNVDPRLNIYSYSQDRLEKYIEMLDWFGFSGCQLLETCATYAAFGQIDSAQEWLGQVMDIIKEQGQDVSLWVWAAQFQGFDWSDPESKYHSEPDQRVFNDPQVKAIFERYYDGYVKHAAKIDRLFGHFYDPGELKNRQDVFDFMRLLEAKAKAKNPDIQMGIDTWAGGDGFAQLLVDNNFKDYLLLNVSMPGMFDPNTREKHYRAAKDLELDMGYWGWFQTEMETDQFPSLFVNAKLLKDFYNHLRKEVFSIYHVEYYSEMEAHHLNNIYSMYAAAQLLWDPDRDPDEILAELTEAIWGPQNGPEVLKALQLIQDVRTGSTWETYWWTSPEYRLGTNDPENDLQRTQKCITELKNMKPDKKFVPKLPLPFAPETFVELMMPHLYQIKKYSEFREKIEDFKEAANAGKEKEQLQKMLQEAWQPIPEYDTWVGVFGTPEFRMQRQTVLNLKKQYDIDVIDPPHLVHKEANRLLQQARNFQSANSHRVEFEPLSTAGQFFWPQEVAQERFQRLIDLKLLLPGQTGKYYLSNWEDWAITSNLKGTSYEK